MTVIAVLAIVAALAAPRGLDRDVFATRAYAAELAAAARLSRSISMASGCPVQLQISNAGYQARQPAVLGTHCAAAGFSTTVARADGGRVQGVAPPNLPFMGTLRWTFNSNGTVQLSGGNTAAVGPHLVTVDAATGTIAGP